MIDVIYPVKLTGFNELKYSVNSWIENFRDLGNIYVMSAEKPDVDDSAIWAPRKDIGLHTDQIIINKLLSACEMEEVSDPFIYCCDDMYLLKEINDSFFDITYRLPDVTPRVGVKHRWRARLHNTLLALRDRGMPYANYSTHIPYLVYKQPFKQAFELMGTDNQICSTYFNYIGGQSAQLHHYPIRAGFYSPKDKDAIMHKVVRATILNHDDRGLNKELKQFIRGRFS